MMPASFPLNNKALLFLPNLNYYENWYVNGASCKSPFHYTVILNGVKDDRLRDLQEPQRKSVTQTSTQYILPFA